MCAPRNASSWRTIGVRLWGGSTSLAGANYSDNQSVDRDNRTAYTIAHAATRPAACCLASRTSTPKNYVSRRNISAHTLSSCTNARDVPVASSIARAQRARCANTGTATGSRATDVLPPSVSLPSERSEHAHVARALHHNPRPPVRAVVVSAMLVIVMTPSQHCAAVTRARCASARSVRRSALRLRVTAPHAITHSTC
jgi:hypothetical protein